MDFISYDLCFWNLEMTDFVWLWDGSDWTI